MIQSKTARRLMYEWHNGQFSALYAAASSGLVENFDRLISEVETIDPKDREKLLPWVKAKKAKHKEVFISNSWYGILPWVSKTY